MTRQLPPLALLAGGLATRMHPLTETIPKALLDVAGEPFIAHQLRLLREQHIRTIVLCTGFLGENIREFVGDGQRFGVQVRYSPDGEKLLGTGGAIKKALPMLGEMFFVMYGDSYLPISFGDVFDAFARQTASGLMTVLRNESQWDKSNVLFKDGQLMRYDKKHPTQDMHYIDYGLSILTPGVFDGWPDASPFDLADLYSTLVQQRKMTGYEVSQRFYEIGSPEGLEETSRYLADIRNDT